MIAVDIERTYGEVRILKDRRCSHAAECDRQTVIPSGSHTRSSAVTLIKRKYYPL
jgi:hypothetical protein